MIFSPSVRCSLKRQTPSHLLILFLLRSEPLSRLPIVLDHQEAVPYSINLNAVAEG